MNSFNFGKYYTVNNEKVAYIGFFAGFANFRREDGSVVSVEPSEVVPYIGANKIREAPQGDPIEEVTVTPTPRRTRTPKPPVTETE